MNKIELNYRFKSILAALMALGMALAPLGSTVPAASAGVKKKKTPVVNARPETPKTLEEPNSEKHVDSYPPLLIGPGDELEIYVVNFSSGNCYVTANSDEMKSQLPTDYLVDSDGP